ncbi:hypothetical protein JCM8547_005740 [Rhodosporidiobolus lusitaniae]
MLARGAACDTCRARKVKCDAARPFCAPCLKSARGVESVALQKCKYEGTSVAAAREAQAAAQAAATGGVGGGGAQGPKRKRAKKVSVGGGGEAGEGGDEGEGRKRMRGDSSEGSVPPPLSRGGVAGGAGEAYRPSSSAGWGNHSLPPPPPAPSSSYHQPTQYAQHSYQQHPQQHPQQHFQPPPPPPSHTASSSYPYPPSYPAPSGASSSSSAGPTPPTTSATEAPANVVEELTGRVAQLERQLRLQAETHAAQLSTASTSLSSTLPPPLSAPPTASTTAGTTPYGHTRSPSFPFAQTHLPPPTYPGGASRPSTAGGGARPLTPGSYPPMQLASQQHSQAGLHFLPPPSFAAGGGGGSTSSASSSTTSSSYPCAFPPGGTSNGSTTLLASPRPLTSGSSGLRTPLPSLSVLGYPPASGVGVGDDAAGGGGGFSLGAGGGGLWSPGMVAESNLRGGGGAGVAAPSPASSLRHLIGAAAMQEEEASPVEGKKGDEGGKRSLWGITGDGATSSHSTSSSSHSSPADGPTNNTTGPSHFASDLDALDPSLFTLLHPLYPPSLPPPRTLSLLVHAFLNRATVPASMLDRGSILRALKVGPTDRAWLEEGLWHALCAYGSYFVSPETLSASALSGGGGGLGLEMGLGEGEMGAGWGRSPYWMAEGDGGAREYHYRKAKGSVESLGGKKGKDLFQVLQTTIILSYLSFCSCRFSDLWFFSGFATRLCTPLGLNHLDPWDFDRGVCGPAGEDWGVRVRFVERCDGMEKVRDLGEHWRRGVTFWLAFAVDRWASASTDWSTSIDEKDISTHLPCTATMPMPSLRIDRTTGQIPSLSINSPHFLEDTSAPIGSIGLYVKATLLLGRVVNFLQRLPRSRCVDRGSDCRTVKEGMKRSKEFIELDVALSTFKSNHSASFYDATGTTIDGFLASAYAIPHVATILLHEAFTDRLDQSPSSSLARCTAAAKCVVNSMFILMQSSADLGGCDPFLPFTWSVTGRALVRDWATRRRWASSSPSSAISPDSPTTPPTQSWADEAEASRQLAEHCMSFIEGCARRGSEIARQHTLALERHLADPDALLPFDGSESWARSAYLEEA